MIYKHKRQLSRKTENEIGRSANAKPTAASQFYCWEKATFCCKLLPCKSYDLLSVNQCVKVKLPYQQQTAFSFANFYISSVLFVSSCCLLHSSSCQGNVATNLSTITGRGSTAETSLRMGLVPQSNLMMSQVRYSLSKLYISSVLCCFVSGTVVLSTVHDSFHLF